MALINPFTLTFTDKTLEQAFSQATLARTRLQGQTAIVVGMFVYLLSGVLDHWYVPTGHTGEVWMTRLTALCVPTFVMGVTFTPWFAGLCHQILAAVGLAAGIGMICMQMLLPLDSSPYYYPMMVLVTFYTYNFVGTRFIFALCVDLALLAAYNLLFGSVIHYPLHILVSHDFFIVSANLIGGSAGYLAEYGQRTLFLQLNRNWTTNVNTIRRVRSTTGLPVCRIVIYSMTALHRQWLSRREKDRYIVVSSWTLMDSRQSTINSLMR